MDSEASRPESSISDSSSSSDNSRQSSVNTANGVVGPKSPGEILIGSPRSIAGERSRSRSRSRSHSPLEDGSAIRSPSKSDSDSLSSSSSSDNENEDIHSAANSRASSPEKHQRSRSEKHASALAGNSRASSRNSSLSSTLSRSNSRNSHTNELRDVAINISHEDLSDVSDMESEKRESLFNNSKPYLSDEGGNAAKAVAMDTESTENDGKFPSKENNGASDVITDLRQKLDLKKSQAMVGETGHDGYDSNGVDLLKSKDNTGESLEDLVKTQDEDDLDFEAEEGECQDVSKEEEPVADETVKHAETEHAKGDKSDGEAEEGEELEEGEVSDEDEKRPEETEPKPVCRFYTRGQCTWGMSCRFLHPGVTDKGNYTMFDLVRPVPLPQTTGASARGSNYNASGADYHDYRTERPSVHHRVALHHPAATFPPHHEPRPLVADGPVVVESAWERGLRTAKEMMRLANKRKEQDMDFEDKKMNLTLSPDELEKDPYYIKERATPPEAAVPYGRHVYQEVPTGLYSPPERYPRGHPIPPFDEVDPYGRTTRYRELPPHRMPQYEDDRRVRPTREVIVQRVEPAGRGDEWNDPWMRSKSPGARGTSRDHSDKRRRDRRSYSSNSSYSSSSSSQSDSSSESSRSPSPIDHKRRYNSAAHKASPPPTSRRHGVRVGHSPSSSTRRLRHSPSIRHSPSGKRRAHVSPSPGQGKRTAYSPVQKRKKPSPIVRKLAIEKAKLNRRHTSSSSGSSDSSGSDSDSDSGSSSSDSSSQSRDRTPPKRSRGSAKLVNKGKIVKKVEPSKKRSPISIEIKKQATVGASALATSPTHSISSEKDSKKSRREELLKQLRAVEDAIAKKRSKLA